MSETETEIGWRIARGELPSPQRLPGFALFALRFSGTGVSWREAHQEHVFRPPEQYLTPEMCQRIAGVPVVAVHPRSGSLDTAAWLETAIGSICFGYIAASDGVLSDGGDELWCIARINDATAAAAMATGQFSTSPAVVFAPDSGNETLKSQDGTTLLAEGRPAVIDHLAAMIDAGVWDKAGLAGPGVRTDSTEGREKVTEEEKAAQARADATKSAEMVGKTLKDLSAKFDSFGSRLDALERGGARHDAERDGWMVEDAAQCARDDADEERERGEMEAKGEPRETAADKARQARRDRVKARKDAMRQDSARLTTEQARAAREVEHANLNVQARADAAFQAWGNRAPPPMAGEATLAYRVRLARHHQAYCRDDSFKNLDLSAIAASQPAALDGFEKIIYADSAAASNDPTHGPEDRLIPLRRTTDGGHIVTEWRGKHTFIRDLKRPSMRATAFMVPPHGRAA